LSDFWKRWHISLSRWLKDYLYIPLGGNRKGRVRTHINLLLTMLLGGLWHGADLKFIIWGFLHGAGLVVEKIWEGIYLTTTDEAIKESAKNNILHYEVISLLEDSSKQYFQKNGSYPKELTELVTAGILKAIPSDPLGYTLKFGENGKIIIK
jgi:hypothetical protein